MSKRNQIRKRLRYLWRKFQALRKPPGRIAAIYSEAYVRALEKFYRKNPVSFRIAILKSFIQTRQAKRAQSDPANLKPLIQLCPDQRTAEQQRDRNLERQIRL